MATHLQKCYPLTSGAFQAPFASCPPTNRDVTVEQMYRFCLDGERIDLVVEMIDGFGLLTQISPE